MIKPRLVAVVAAKGLGDGLISCVLSHHLQLAGHKVTTFNTALCPLSKWFPEHTLRPFPSLEEITTIFSPFDQIIAFDHSLLSESTQFPDKLMVLREHAFDKRQTLVENLSRFAFNTFSSPLSLNKNGITPREGLHHKKYPQRVVIHPMSTDPDRTWPKKKFLLLAKKLVHKGYQPVFLMCPLERACWKDVNPDWISPLSSLDETAAYIYESGYLIGNNSGLGHLASNLGIPTLSLFSRMSYARLWRPGFGNNRVVTPYPLLLGARWKQKYWKELLTVGRVMDSFCQLVHAQAQKGEEEISLLLK